MVCPDCSLSDDFAAVATHDLSKVAYHVRLPNWLDSLSKAIEAAWPGRHVAYTEVTVLMLNWEQGDMPQGLKEIKRLRSIFEEGFHYKVESWTIPLKDADLTTPSAVQGFILAHSKPDSLVIIYYAGHAKPGPSGSPPIWQPSASPEDGQEFDTALILPTLTRAREDSPDVVLLFDCCNPLYAQRSQRKPTRAVVECIYAGGFESRVPIAGPDSFTSALINELGTAAEKKEGLSVTDLHRRVIVRLQSFQPQPLFDVNDKVRTSSNGDIICTKDIRITPNHLFLSANDPLRSIHLQPGSEQLSNGIDNQSASRQDRIASQSWPRVCISVQLSDSDQIAQELQRWLLGAPPGVVSFKGIYPSFSTLLLAEVPLVVWNLLPPCAAVSFVGFVNGPLGTRNLISKGEKTTRASHELPKTEPLKHQSGNLEERKLFSPRTIDEQTKIALMDGVDEVVGKILKDSETIRNSMTQDIPTMILTEVCREFARDSDKYGHIPEECILQHRGFLLQYLGAKELLARDNGVLRICDRLSPVLAMCRFYDDEQEGPAESTTSTSAVPRSSFWDRLSSRQPFSIDTRSTGSEVIEERESRREKASSRKASQDPHNRLHNFSIPEEQDELAAINISTSKDVDRGPYRTGSGLLSKYTPSTEALRVANKSSRPAQRPQNTSNNDDNDITVASVSPSATASTVKPSSLVGSIGSTDAPSERLDENRSDVASLSRSPWDHKGKSRAAKDQKKPHRSYRSSPYRSENAEDTGWSDPVYDENSERWYKWRLTETGETEYLWVEPDSTLASAHEARSESGEYEAKPGGPRHTTEQPRPHEHSDTDAYATAVASAQSQIYAAAQPAYISAHSYSTYSHQEPDPGFEGSSHQDHGDKDQDLEEYIIGTSGDFEEVDPRYRVEPSWRFEPGTVFKILWSEPLGQSRAFLNFPTSDIRQDETKRFYIGYRRFLIVATDEGHSTCVPILTYERKGCKKKGLHPSKHGIIYPKGSKPRLLKDEPRLGYEPVAVRMSAPEETLAKESRVNYSKLVTIEHTVKVFFIGTVDPKDFATVQFAVNDSWEKKWPQSAKKPKKSERTGHSHR